MPALSADTDYLQLEVPAEYVIPAEKVETQPCKLDISKTPGGLVPSCVLRGLFCLPAQLPQSTTAHFVRGMLSLLKKKPPEDVEIS